MTITYRQDVDWHNFHRTIGDRRDELARRYQVVAELAELAQEPDGATGLAHFAACASDVFVHLEHLLASQTDATRTDAGLQGAAWSFAPLVGNPAAVFDCASIKTLALATDEELADPSADGGRIAFVGAGSTLDELTAWSEPMGLTLMTSGTFLHSSVAGSIATASHGSRLGYGGIQNMVRGLHIVTAPGRHHWIERASAPVLSDQAMLALSAAGPDVTVVRDDRHFENALIHLGAMGVIVGLAIELTQDRQFAALRLAKAIDDDWLQQIERGNFANLARRHGVDHAPQFYELTIKPTAPFDEPALHIWYFHSVRTNPAAAGSPALKSAEAFSGLAAKTLAPIEQSFKGITAGLTPPSAKFAAADVNPDDLDRALALVLRNAKSAFDYYRGEGGFLADIGTFDPASSDTPSGSWRALHQGEITTGQPGALYNASFAIARERTGEALRAICAAVADLPPIFLFTLRFVSQPAGTLAFTRFQENTVIEIDGLSPLAMDWATAAAAANPATADLVPIIQSISATTATGAARVRTALRDARIDYSMHWGKLGDLDGAKVVADFGANGDGDVSLIREWQETRELLVPPGTRHVFENAAIRNYRLV